MAVVRFCDWTKRRVAIDEEMTPLNINGEEFELSQEGLEQLLSRLRADELPKQALPPYPPGVRFAERQEQALPQPQPVQVEAGETEDRLPEDVMAQDEPFQLEVPDDPNKRLGVPSRATYERVIREATIREPGTLPSLSDPQGRKEAARKLAELENKHESAYRQSAGRDVNIGDPKNKNSR